MGDKRSKYRVEMGRVREREREEKRKKKEGEEEGADKKEALVVYFERFLLPTAITPLGKPEQRTRNRS